MLFIISLIYWVYYIYFAEILLYIDVSINEANEWSHFWITKGPLITHLFMYSFLWNLVYVKEKGKKVIIIYLSVVYFIQLGLVLLLKWSLN